MTDVLAQFDLVSPKFPKNDARMDAFYSSSKYVNGLAESHQGFIWRETNENLQLLYELWGEGYLYTLSLWKDVSAFKSFLYNSPHSEFIRRGREWFNPISMPRVVMWWVPEGHIPSLQDAHERMKMLYEIGPSYNAFDLKNSDFPISAY
ncbi:MULTISPECIES: DUF3291 domain-containing protein [unclassified Pseudomonas]|uniref:DUF3291 domain-containing protein n=1 Tax=unclassified Pseudomonas TaxID=196821 RepID=UPI002B231EC5|nr:MULTISPECIES: DUF3291 domain-containing protein [unclassified Pseudomonas]MEA9977281.1 DUF3291 domain-containing protein [Pseudomonas sp. RTS4]MEB0198226.1 DUF3291 domain-containing protein [Pseudomonas sp. 5S4]MEB0247080.1 DUF3291 domain-containing protein [Pseudomonas sp. 10S5]